MSCSHWRFACLRKAALCWYIGLTCFLSFRRAVWRCVIRPPPPPIESRRPWHRHVVQSKKLSRQTSPCGTVVASALILDSERVLECHLVSRGRGLNPPPPGGEKKQDKWQKNPLRSRPSNLDNVLPDNATDTSEVLAQARLPVAT